MFDKTVSRQIRFLILIGILVTLLSLNVVAMPGETSIITDKHSYTQFETVRVTLRANDLNYPVNQFRAWATYGSEGSTDYAYEETDISAHFVSGYMYEATFTFQATKGNEYIYIQSLAFDSMGPGPVNSTGVYVVQYVPASSDTNGGNTQGSTQTSDEPVPHDDATIPMFIAGFSIVVILLLIIIAIIIRKKGN